MDTDQTLSGILQELSRATAFEILIVVAVAIAVISIVERALPWVADHGPARLRLYILPLTPILRLLVLVAAALFILPLVVKPSVQNMLAIAGAAGLAIGFGFRDYVTSLIGGVVAIVERPYQPGDWVRVDDAYGEVRSLGTRAFSMVTPDDTVVTIPNSKMWTTSIFNANAGSRTLLCVADFYLHPEHDGARARERLRDVALTSAYLRVERPVVVTVSETPWGTHYRLKGYPIDARDQFELVSDLTVRGKAALKAIGARAAATPAVAPGAAG